MEGNASAKAIRSDGPLRSASNTEITELFNSVTKQFCNFVREQISLGGPQMSLLVNILSRDGNCIARTSWIERLYEQEREALSKKSASLMDEIRASSENENYNRGRRLSIYNECFETAYKNDLRVNREAKITDDERMILNTLMTQLGMSKDEAAAIEHIYAPVPKGHVQEALNSLREIGVVFIDRKQSEVLVADEVVSILHEIQGKEIPDKYVLRILRSLSDPEFTSIYRRHELKARGVTRRQKIRNIVQCGLSMREVLSKDIFTPDEKISNRKDRLKLLISDLNISPEKLGTTLDERISVLFDSIKSGADEEFNALSASGFKELLDSLGNLDHVSVENSNSEEVDNRKVLERLREEFEIEDSEILNTERLRALSISPLDILYVYTNEEIRKIRDSLGLSNRKNPRMAILESYASATDKLIENYELLACRDIAGLKAVGIDIREAEIGTKFEEITRTLLEHLGQNVDEDLRKEINTAKDKADIIISLSDDDVIVGEAKSHKNGDFTTYSTTSRQVKSYVSRCESNGKRVAQVLIIAPAFSSDFIASAEMDTDINISLLEAQGLKKIVAAYKSRKNPKFSIKLLTKGGLLKSDLIAKSI